MDDDSVVIPKVDQLKIYLNEEGDVVIRQGDDNDDDPDFVLFNPVYIPQVIIALRDLKKLSKEEK